MTTRNPAAAACALCGATPLTPETGRYVKCGRCGTISRTDDPASVDNISRSGVYMRGLLAQDIRMFGLLRDLAPEARALLDLGCGNGSFVKHAVANGWRAVGMEGNGELVSAARQEGAPVERVDLDTWASGRSGEYDVVRLWYVLEHLRLPGRLLAEAGRSLKPGGLLLLAVPNDAGWLSRLVMRSESDRFWEHPLHLHHFPPFGLERWLSGRGFEIVLAEASRPAELMRDGALPLLEAWEETREKVPELCRIFYQLGVGRGREIILRKTEASREHPG